MGVLDKYRPTKYGEEKKIEEPKREGGVLEKYRPKPSQLARPITQTLPSVPTNPMSGQLGQQITNYLSKATPTALPAITSPSGHTIGLSDRQKYRETTRQGYAQALQDNIGARVHAGFMEGLSPVSMKEQMGNRYGQETLNALQESTGYKVGEIAGIMGQFAIPYAGAAPKIGRALNQIPRVANMGKVGQAVARSVATDLAVGVPLNVNYALNKEGLRGEEALKSVGVNTAIDLIAGGVLEVIGGVVLKSGKRVASKADFDALPAPEKQEVQLLLTGPVEPQRLLTEGQNWGPPIRPDYYVNRGGVASPDVGNVRVAGELPAPDKINPVLNPTRRTLADPYKEFNTEYEKAVESVADYIQNYKSKGVHVGVVPKYGDELMRDGGVRYAQSNNDLWYQDFYKRYGRAPRKSEADEIARELVDEGLAYGRGEFYDPDLHDLLRRSQGGGLYYRGTRSSTDPMSDWGHAMFADSKESAYFGDGSGNYGWTYDGKDAVSVSDLEDDIIKAWKSDIENDSFSTPALDYIAENTPVEDIVKSFDPDDIVDYAAAWDDGELTQWIWDRVLEPRGIAAVKTSDGAIVFDKDMISPYRVKNSLKEFPSPLSDRFPKPDAYAAAKGQKEVPGTVTPGEISGNFRQRARATLNAQNQPVQPQTPQTRTNVPDVSEVTPKQAPRTTTPGYKPKRKNLAKVDAELPDLPLRQSPGLKPEARNAGDHILVGDKFNKLTKDHQKSILTHENAHNVSNKHLFEDGHFVDIMNNKAFGESKTTSGGRTYWEGIFGDVGATSVDETFTEAIALYYRNPEWLKEMHPQAFDYIERMVKKNPSFSGKPKSLQPRTPAKASQKQKLTQKGIKSVGADAAKPEKTIDELVKEHGAIPKGEQPRAREVDIPKKTDHGDVQRHARTLQESAIVDDTLFKEINDEISKGSFTISSKSNKVAVANANATLESKGLDESLDKFKSILKADKKVTSEDIALGNRVLQELQKSGRYDEALETAMDLSEMLSETGRTLQAAKIAKRLSPEGRLMTATRAAEKISKKTGKKIKLSDETVEQISKARTEKEIIEANEKAGVEIWDQTPAKWIDKVNSWRYIAMLMNPKTHMRNIVGNALFVPAREFKNVIGAGLEKALIKDGVRTKAILNAIKDKDIIKFASNDFENVRAILKGEGKIDESFRKLEAKVYKTKWLEWVRKMNLKALDVEDTWFMKYAYDSSLAQYMKANGIKPEKMVGEVLEKGRKYAMDEALKATYRDFNSLANLISRAKVVGASGKYGIMGQVGSAALEAVIPFAKTPMNLVKRGVGYSPANIVRGLVNLNFRVKSGKVTATEAIDQLASGLSGTAVLGLGTLLGYYNIVTGKEGEYRDKSYNYNQMLGSQDYSLNVDGTSFTLDWAAPMSMVFFVGVELSKAIKDEGGSLAAVLDAYTKITDPMVNMSMLRGINDILTNNFEGIGQTAMDVGIGYAGQFNPTVFGQIARTADGTRRSTTSTAETGLGRTVEKFGRKQLAKIPGASQKLEPYVDLWGREQKTGNIIENFLSPGYFKQSNITPVDRELRDLMKGLDEDSVKKVLPTSSAYQYTVQASGETYRMTEKESTAYQKTRGEEGYKGLEKLFSSSKYKSMTKEEKVKAIEDVYGEAKEKATYNYLASKNLPVTMALGKEQHAKYQSVKKTGLSDVKYYRFRKKIEALETVNQETAEEALDGSNMSLKQKEAMWYTINSGWTEASNPFKDPSTNYNFKLMNDTRQEKFTYVEGSGVTKQQYANVLGRADTNGNGSITKEELRIAMLREGLNSQQRHAMYKVVNSNWKGE